MLPNSRVLAVAGAAALAATACLPPLAATPSDDPDPERVQAGRAQMMGGN